MKFDKETVKYIAKLAKLSFNEAESQELASEFEVILEHLKNLENVDLAGVEDGIKSEEGGTFIREDKSVVFDDKDKLFRNAREIRDGYIVIPKVLD